MNVVINACHGGFGLSAAALRAYAAKKNRGCYFFEHKDDRYVSVVPKQNDFCPTAFDIPNPNEVIGKQPDWRTATKEESEAWSNRYRLHVLDSRPDDRADPDLVAVVDELGTKAASGACACLEVVEIPDNIEWQIEECDGYEHIAEKHRTWG